MCSTQDIAGTLLLDNDPLGTRAQNSSADSSQMSSLPVAGLTDIRFWPTQLGCDLGKATGRSDEQSSTPFEHPAPFRLLSVAVFNSLDPRKVSGLRKEEQIAFATRGFCPFRTLWCEPLATFAGLWILEGDEHAPPPRILGQVLSWSQARTGPGSFSRLTITPPTCSWPFCPHTSPQCLPHKKRQAGRWVSWETPVTRLPVEYN